MSIFKIRAKSSVLILLSFFLSVYSASAQSDPSQFIFGFNNKLLKRLVSKERDVLDESLRPIFKSIRARQQASKTIGRLKRGIVDRVSKGAQRHITLIDAKLITPREKSDLRKKKVLRQAMERGLVRYAEPNITLSIFRTPKDPNFSSMWGLHNSGQSLFSVADIDINAPEAWDIATSSGSAVVAIVDTGVDPSTPDLKENIWTNSGEVPANGVDDDKNGYIDDVHGCDLTAYENATSPTCGIQPFHNNPHGTHVAGTIAAKSDNNLGISGIVWDTKIMSLAFLTEDGNGSLLDMIEALSYIADSKRLYNKSKGSKGANVRIVNASYGHNDGFMQSEYDAISALRKLDILFVAAAGNGGPDGLGDNNDQAASYPAGYELDNLIAVASVNRYSQLSYFSNYGSNSVHIAAPGEDIQSTVFNGQYESLSGTSMATPHVSGVAALVMGHRPDLPAWIVREILIASAKDQTAMPNLRSLQGKVFSGGMLDAYQALILSESDIALPRIVKQSKSSTVSVGASISLNVTAMGSDPLIYQWSKDGATISGAISNTLKIKDITTSDSGNYTCTVSNNLGSTNSKAINITISTKPNGDANGDSVVDFKDMILVLGSFGKKGANLVADLNKDGIVDFADLQIVLGSIGS